VISFVHQLKVRVMVIAGVAIDVMHHFGRSEKSADALLNHETVFHHIALAVRLWVIRREHGKVFAAPSIGDARQAWGTWFSPLAGGSTLNRAEALGALASAGARLATRCTQWSRHSLAPSRHQVTHARTVGLLWPRWLWREGLPTSAAGVHRTIIAVPRLREEKYCEVIAQRLAQGALFEVSA
jgi:hypothetical protein